MVQGFAPVSNCVYMGGLQRPEKTAAIVLEPNMSSYTANLFQPPAWIQRFGDRTAAHGQLALTLVVCVAGALAASALHLPLAWMVGPLLLTTVVAIGGMQTAIPVRLRDGGNAVLGLLLGCSFSPDVIGHLGPVSRSTPKRTTQRTYSELRFLGF